MIEVWCSCPQCKWDNLSLAEPISGASMPFICDDCGAEYEGVVSIYVGINDAKVTKRGTKWDQ